MTATCEAALGICVDPDIAYQWRPARGDFGDPFEPIVERRVQRQPLLWARIFNVLRTALLDTAVKSFVDAVSQVPEVEEVVLFNDGEGTHLWTALSSPDWDAETAVLDAHRFVRRAFRRGEIDLFVLPCTADEFEAGLPAGFVRLYLRG